MDHDDAFSDNVNIASISSSAVPAQEEGYDDDDADVANMTTTRRRADPGRHSSSLDPTTLSSSAIIEFVDYIPPTPPLLPPPPKYKLWLIVLILAYILVLLGSGAGIVAGMSKSGWLNTKAALFIYLAIIILVLTYAMTELTMYCCTITIRGTTYGLGAWLKRPRIQWVRCTNDESRNCILELIACVVIILEDGFQMFNPPPRIVDRYNKKQYDHDETELQNYDEEEPIPVVLRIEHHINPKKQKKYSAWRSQLTKLVHDQPGLFTIISHDTIDVSDDNDESLRVLYLKFTSIEALNVWMHSPTRMVILAKLQPILLAPSVFQLQKDRLLPDTFTDLVTRQGEGVPTLLPKKWKVFWLSTIGLWIVIFLRDMILPHYLEKWGLNDSPEWVQIFVELVIAFASNAYVMTPFLMMLFSEWMRRKEDEKDTEEPWRTLNDGVPYLWQKIVIVAAYCGKW